jgi:hypothetical protein
LRTEKEQLAARSRTEAAREQAEAEEARRQEEASRAEAKQAEANAAREEEEAQRAAEVAAKELEDVHQVRSRRVGACCSSVWTGSAGPARDRQGLAVFAAEKISQQ